MEAYSNLKPWRPGQSGNLNGRPVGSRSAFSAGFTRDLAEVWAEKGKASMLYTAEKQPAVFFATCARLLPNDVRVTVEQHLPGNLSIEDWTIMREIVAAGRQAIPYASSKPPVRATQAKTIKARLYGKTPRKFALRALAKSRFF
jgi:hypothetical protein